MRKNIRKFSTGVCALLQRYTCTREYSLARIWKLPLALALSIVLFSARQTHSPPRLLHATHPLFGARPPSPTTLFPTTTFFHSSAPPRRHESSPTPNLLSSWTYSAAQGSSHPLLPRSYPNVHILAVRTPGTIFGRAAPPCLLSSLCLSAHSCSCAPLYPLFIPLHLSCSRKPRIRHHSPTAILLQKPRAH